VGIEISQISFKSFSDYSYLYSIFLIIKYKKVALSYCMSGCHMPYISYKYLQSGAMKKIVQFCEEIACQSSVSCLCVCVCVSACENGALEHPES